MRRLADGARSTPASTFHSALIHVGLGEHARALDLLERAADERTWLFRLLAVEPKYRSLRGEARFDALLERLALDP